MKREIVKIDRDKCNGCGDCIPNCHEGALQMIDNKATLVSELMCDGLGACIGHCPVGAISIEKREAQAYDEIAVIKEMIPQGEKVLLAHMGHLKEHGETEYLRQARQYLLEQKESLDFDPEELIAKVHEQEHDACGAATSARDRIHAQGGCPGSMQRDLKPGNREAVSGSNEPSALSQWPVQLHLINPGASSFKGAHLLLAADCVAYAMGGFHSRHLAGKKLAIACPKLDSGLDSYINKLSTLIDEAEVPSINIMRMEVPCCSGLEQMVKQALANSKRKPPVQSQTISIQGELLRSELIV
jgi:NAD-dependent dihydropyrimidine dehydrogenase PreA subunit